jgi:hypothetical protein
MMGGQGCGPDQQEDALWGIGALIAYAVFSNVSNTGSGGRPQGLRTGLQANLK